MYRMGLFSVFLLLSHFMFSLRDAPLDILGGGGRIFVACKLFFLPPRENNLFFWQSTSNNFFVVCFPYM